MYSTLTDCLDDIQSLVVLTKTASGASVGLKISQFPRRVPTLRPMLWVQVRLHVA